MGYHETGGKGAAGAEAFVFIGDVWTTKGAAPDGAAVLRSNHLRNHELTHEQFARTLWRAIMR